MSSPEPRLSSFSEGLSCTAYPYLVAAVTLHLGPDLLSGHYRSVLLQAEGLKWGSWITEDGIAAAKTTTADQERMQDSSYLIWLIRAEIPHRSQAL